MRLGWMMGIVLVWTTPVLANDHLPLLQKYCYECHGNGANKGDFRIDNLATSVRDDATAQAWGRIVERMSDGTMPPRNKPRPTTAEAQTITRSITAQLRARSQSEGRTQLRRLNRLEYQNTLRDLLGVEANLSDMLPDDSVTNGFDNTDSVLTLSPVLLERYFEAAEAALAEVFTPGPAPKTITKRAPLIDPKAPVRNGYIVEGNDAILFHSGNYLPTVWRAFRAPTAGRYRFRVPVQAFQSPKAQIVRIYAGAFAGEARSVLVDYFDAPPEGRIIEFTARLEKNDTIQVLSQGIGHKNIADPKTYTGVGLRIGEIEATGPLIESWPAPGTKRLLAGVDLQRGQLADARKILSEFLPRAFRRPTTAADVEPFLKLIATRLQQGQSFEESLRIGLKAVLCSPRFLFREEPAGELDDYALASRLSYFIWSSMPDDELFRIAATGKLKRDPALLRDQVERMFADPRAKAFTESFTGQWLGLRNIDFTTPDKKLYPEFDEFLQESMVRETRAYFDEMLHSNRPVLQFIDSDWTFLNGRLARHYGISDVDGVTLRLAKLPTGSQRGGILTHASVLKVTANGTTTSPVLRGVWVLDRILGQPVPPPPANVPAVEPDTRGATTIRDQLAKHRSEANCASCHVRIDPVGFALEGFDAIGGRRDRYRLTTPDAKRSGISVPFEDTTRYVFVGPNVDVGDVMPDGQRFRNFDEFRRILMQKPEPIVRNLAMKLMVYATGHPVGPADTEVLNQIVAATRSPNDGFRSLIHRIVQSETFRNK